MPAGIGIKKLFQIDLFLRKYGKTVIAIRLFMMKNIFS